MNGYPAIIQQFQSEMGFLRVFLTPLLALNKVKNDSENTIPLLATSRFINDPRDFPHSTLRRN